MTYVVVNEATGVKVTFPRTGKSMYDTLRTARAAVTRLVKIDMDEYFAREVQTPTKYTIMELAAYNAQVPMITIINKMTGKPQTIPADTPWSCRPDSDAYWSM